MPLKNVPEQLSRKYDSTAPVVPARMLMHSEPTLSHFNPGMAASQRQQECKSLNPTVTASQRYQELKSYNRAESDALADDGVAADPYKQAMSKLVDTLIDDDDDLSAEFETFKSEVLRLNQRPNVMHNKAYKDAQTILTLSPSDLEDMRTEQNTRKADEREAISNEMCNIVKDHSEQLVQMAKTLRKHLQDDLDHSNPISHTKPLEHYRPTKPETSNVLDYYSKTHKKRGAHIDELRVPKSSAVSPTAKRIAVDIVRHEMRETSPTSDDEARAARHRRSIAVRKGGRVNRFEYDETVYMDFSLIRRYKKVLHEYAKTNILRQADEVQYHLRLEHLDPEVFYKPKHFFDAEPRPPFQVQGKLLCQYVAACIKVPCADPQWKYINMSGGPEARRIFTSAMTMRCSIRVTIDLFWYCHIRRYQKLKDAYGAILPEAKESLRILTKRISQNYAMLVSGVKSKASSLKDFVFRFYPFAVSHAVVCGFYYMCPASRSVIVKYPWQHGVWLDVCGLLSGVAITPSTVQIMRDKLFGNDEASKRPGDDDNEEDLDNRNATSRRNAKIELPPPTDSLGFVDIGLTGPSRVLVSKSHDLKGKLYYFTGFGPQLLNERKALKADVLSFGALLAPHPNKANIIVRPSHDFHNPLVASASHNERMHVITLDDLKDQLYKLRMKRDGRTKSRQGFRGKQPRVTFDGGHASPWCSELFGTESMKGTQRVNLRRTLPVENCLSGGQNTYHPAGMDDAAPIIARIQNEVADNRAEYSSQVREMRSSLRGELQKVGERMHAVLHTGGSQTAKAFCFDLRQRKVEEQQRKLEEEKEGKRQQQVREALKKQSTQRHRPVRRRGNGPKNWAEKEGLVWNVLPLATSSSVERSKGCCHRQTACIFCKHKPMDGKEKRLPAS